MFIPDEIICVIYNYLGSASAKRSLSMVCKKYLSLLTIFTYTTLRFGKNIAFLSFRNRKYSHEYDMFASDIVVDGSITFHPYILFPFNKDEIFTIWCKGSIILPTYIFKSNPLESLINIDFDNVSVIKASAVDYGMLCRVLPEDLKITKKRVTFIKHIYMNLYDFTAGEGYKIKYDDDTVIEAHDADEFYEFEGFVPGDELDGDNPYDKGGDCIKEYYREKGSDYDAYIISGIDDN